MKVRDNRNSHLFRHLLIYNLLNYLIVLLLNYRNNFYQVNLKKHGFFDFDHSLFWNSLHYLNLKDKYFYYLNYLYLYIQLVYLSLIDYDILLL